MVHPILGRVDAAENILANKITAVLSREEPKDLADIWGLCCQRGLDLQQTISGAQGKAAGIFVVDLARVLISVRREDWQVVRWIQAPEPARYLADLRDLGERLLQV